MDKKSPDAFRTISEVADWLGVPTHVLRFWESRFSQVKPVKRAGGRRYYRPADMELLGGIRKLLHDDGMTIRGVQKLLREEGPKHVAAMAPTLDEEAMKDITPSNVVDLHSPEAPAEETPAPLDAAQDAPQPPPNAEAPQDTPPVETAPVDVPAAEVTTADVAPADVVTDPAPVAPPGATPEPITPASPTQEAAPETSEAPPPAPSADPQPVFDFDTTTSTPDVPEPAAADVSEAASASPDTLDNTLESPEEIDFHAHGTDVAPPPISTTPPVEPVSTAPPVEDDTPEDPDALPRLGADDLPTVSDTPAPIAPPVASEATSTPEPPQPTAPQPADLAAEQVLPETIAPSVTASPAAPDAPTPEPQPEPEPVSAPVETTTPPESPPAPSIDISHVAADPSEEDISPSGPSLPARMRRLSSAHPKGSPAQIQALSDRLQELSGRLSRDNQHRTIR